VNGRDRAIAFQNATSAAATVYAALESSTQPFDPAEFNVIRDAIYAYTEERLAAFYALDQFPGATLTAQPAPAAAPAPGAPAPEPPATVAPLPAGPAPLAPLPGAAAPDTGKEAIWKELFADPSKFYDNRADKQSGKASTRSPDFKRISDKAALWISSKDTPGWVRQQLGNG
jgi:hypothetical protein